MEQEFSQHIWNFDKTPVVREEELDGRKFLVVPMSMILEGVHAGSQGAIYYSKNELSKTPKMWNMKPILVYHPKKGDTATDLSIYKSQAIGMIMNTIWKNGKLKAEAWIDKKKAEKIEPDVLKHIEAKVPMEVSTGLFADCELDEGEWQGEHYDAIAKNIRADHLAILPDKAGACSLKDGAGLLMNQAQVGVSQDTGSVQKQASLNDLRDSLTVSLMESLPATEAQSRAYVVDIFQTFFIWTDGYPTRQHFKQDYVYNVETKKSCFVGTPVPTKCEVRYVLEDGTVLNVSGNKIAPLTVVKWIQEEGDLEQELQKETAEYRKADYKEGDDAGDKHSQKIKDIDIKLVAIRKRIIDSGLVDVDKSTTARWAWKDEVVQNARLVGSVDSPEIKELQKEAAELRKKVMETTRQIYVIKEKVGKEKRDMTPVEKAAMQKLVQEVQKYKEMVLLSKMNVKRLGSVVLPKNTPEDLKMLAAASAVLEEIKGVSQLNPFAI